MSAAPESAASRPVTGTNPRLVAALDCAALGLPILPIWWRLPNGGCACGDAECRSPGKHPIGELVPTGLHGATVNPAVLTRWFRRYPAANLAVRTGPESGLLVLDVDGPAGEAALAALERRHGALPDAFPMQRTGSGGGRWQAFFAYPVGRDVGNSARKLGPDLDTRGRGGYVLLPPSATAGPYAWEADRDPFVLLPPPAPEWLVDLLDPPLTVREPWAVSPARAGGGGAYAVKALESELALVAVAPPGRRNTQLNASAHALFRFCARGELDTGIVTRGLLAAAQHAGLVEREAAATIRSAARSRGVAL